VCTSGTIGRSSRTSKGESIHSSWISYLWRASANGLPRAAINPKGGCRVALSRKGPRDRSSLGVPHYDFPRLSGQGAAKRRKACRAWPGATSSWDEGKGDERGGRVGGSQANPGNHEGCSGLFPRGYRADIFEELASTHFHGLLLRRSGCSPEDLFEFFLLRPVRGTRMGDNGFSLAKHVFAVPGAFLHPSPASERVLE